jgi:hypothetical protein
MSDLAQDLDDALAEIDDDLLKDDPESTEIDDVTAERYAFAFKRTQSELVEINRLAELRQREIDDWVERRQSKPLEKLAWLRQALDHYARTKVGRRAKDKHADLPSGRLQLVAPTGRVEVTDPDAFVTWAVANERYDLINVPEPPQPTPRKAEIAKAFRKHPQSIAIGNDLIVEFVDNDGESIPGIAWVVAARDTFKITPTQEDK